MELFLPSLFLLFLSGIVVFFIIPRMSSLLLFILSVLFLVIAVFAHYSMFKNEYRYDTMFYTFSNIQQPLITAVIVIGIVVALLNMTAGLSMNKLFSSISSFSFFKNPTEDQILISNTKNYKNIPYEKLAELEKQL